MNEIWRIVEAKNGGLIWVIHNCGKDWSMWTPIDINIHHKKIATNCCNCIQPIPKELKFYIEMIYMRK